MPTAAYWIDHLNLKPLPEEDGLYREVYRSDESIPAEALPNRFDGSRAYSTSIYYLLEHPDFSAFHRIQQEEIWHFYDGASCTVHIINPETGALSQPTLGRDVAAGEQLQIAVPRGHLFAATVDTPESYMLAGCTVAPGFEFADFEAPPRQVLLDRYPRHADLITRLTR